MRSPVVNYILLLGGTLLTLAVAVTLSVHSQLSNINETSARARSYHMDSVVQCVGIKEALARLQLMLCASAMKAAAQHGPAAARRAKLAIEKTLHVVERDTDTLVSLQETYGDPAFTRTLGRLQDRLEKIHSVLASSPRADSLDLIQSSIDGARVASTQLQLLHSTEHDVAKTDLVADSIRGADRLTGYILGSLFLGLVLLWHIVRSVRALLTRDADARRKLKRAMVAAEESNRLKSEFLANMSHEIRTPMTAILGFAESLLDTNLTEAEILDSAQTIRRNGESLLAIINDILDLSKIEAGKMNGQRIACHPCVVVADVLALVQVQADAKGLTLDIEYEGPIPKSIRTDPIRLRQILINLIGNAIKFTETGGVRLITRRIDCGPRSCLQFDVIDSGRGLSATEKQKLFQPFMQADASATRPVGGTGLGLTISRRFAELLGGDVTLVESEQGRGSTFRVTVATGPLDGVPLLDDPMAATVVPETVTPIEDPLADLDGLRILLTEDGPDNQRLISFILERAGATVTVAENGQVGLDTAIAAQLESDPFDCILMDVQMPVMDGYEATRELRAQGYAGPIIALTAHAMSADRKKCLDAGCDDYATKPINRQILIEMIRKALPDQAASSGPVLASSARGVSPK